jgi:hypothetical protein
MQKDKDGRIKIVSTASRILTPSEQGYTNCELELMATVYVLRKIRVHIYGNTVTRSTDHMFIIIFRKCVVTSNPVYRWMWYVFFWVIPRRLNFICRRFGTLCSIFIGK